MPPKKKLAFPEDCCGACKYSHDIEGQLECFGNPPTLFGDEAGQLIYVRSVAVSPEDFTCHLFVNRQHS